MNWRMHLLYWILPGAAMGMLVTFYFSEIELLETIAAPRQNRELGLVETIQKVEIAAIFVLALLGWRRAAARIERAAFGFVMVLAFLVLGEEMDWGFHIVYAFTGKALWSGTGSLHNIGDTTHRIKLVVDTGTVVFFVLLPLFVRNSRNEWVRYFTPATLSIATLLCGVVISKSAHYLQDEFLLNSDGSLRGNISEFREFFTYYVALLYMYEIVLRRTSPAQIQGAGRCAGELIRLERGPLPGGGQCKGEESRQRGRRA